MSEQWVMVVVGMPALLRADAPAPDVVGHALEWYDADAHGGQGDASFTTVPAAAKVFSDAGEVIAEWKRVSTVRPLRADGKPNRPLAAFTISPTRMEDWVSTLHRYAP